MEVDEGRFATIVFHQHPHARQTLHSVISMVQWLVLVDDDGVADVDGNVDVDHGLVSVGADDGRSADNCWWSSRRLSIAMIGTICDCCGQRWC